MPLYFKFFCNRAVQPWLEYSIQRLLEEKRTFTYSVALPAKLFQWSPISVMSMLYDSILMPGSLLVSPAAPPRSGAYAAGHLAVRPGPHMLDHQQALARQGMI